MKTFVSAEAVLRVLDEYEIVLSTEDFDTVMQMLVEQFGELAPSRAAIDKVVMSYLGDNWSRLMPLQKLEYRVDDKIYDSFGHREGTVYEVGRTIAGNEYVRYRDANGKEAGVYTGYLRKL